MVNCVCLYNPLRNSCFKSKHLRIVQVVKTDGKTIEFKSPILVKDLLEKFPGLGVCFSRKSSSKHLPLSYELKLVKIYYLHASPVKETEQSEGVKRIKVIITKKQLQELLSKQVLVERKDFLSVKSKLESIPEGIEL